MRGVVSIVLPTAVTSAARKGDWTIATGRSGIAAVIAQKA
jgi:hypothetical protein